MDDILFQPNDSTIQNDITSTSDMTSHTSMTTTLISTVDNCGIAYNKTSDGTDVQYFINVDNTPTQKIFYIDSTTDQTVTSYGETTIKMDSSTNLRAKLFDKNNKFNTLSSIFEKTYDIIYLYDISIHNFDSTSYLGDQDTTILIEQNSDYTIYEPYAPDCTTIDAFNLYGILPNHSHETISDQTVSIDNILTLHGDETYLKYTTRNKLIIYGKNVDGKQATNKYTLNYYVLNAPCTTQLSLVTNDYYITRFDFGYFGNMKQWSNYTQHGCVGDNFYFEYDFTNTTPWRDNSDYPDFKIRDSLYFEPKDYLYYSETPSYYKSVSFLGHSSMKVSTKVDVDGGGYIFGSLSYDYTNCDLYSRIPLISHDSTSIILTSKVDQGTDIFWRNSGDTDQTNATGLSRLIDYTNIEVDNTACDITIGTLGKRYKYTTPEDCISPNNGEQTKKFKYYFEEAMKVYILVNYISKLYISSGESIPGSNDIENGRYTYKNYIMGVTIPSAGWYSFDVAQNADYSGDSTDTKTFVMWPQKITNGWKNYIDKSLLNFTDTTSEIELFSRFYNVDCGAFSTNSGEYLKILGDSNIMTYNFNDTTSKVNPPTIHYDKWAIDLEIDVWGVDDNNSEAVDLNYRIYFSDETNLPDYTTVNDMTGSIHLWDQLIDNTTYFCEAYAEKTNVLSSDIVKFKFETATCSFNEPTVYIDTTTKLVTVTCDEGNPAAFYKNNFWRNGIMIPSSNKGNTIWTYGGAVTPEKFMYSPELNIGGIYIEDNTSAIFGFPSYNLDDIMKTYLVQDYKYEFKCVDFTNSCVSPSKFYDLSYPENTMMPPYQNSTNTWYDGESTWRLYKNSAYRPVGAFTNAVKYRINGGEWNTSTSTYANVSMSVGDVLEAKCVDLGEVVNESWLILAKRVA